MVLHVAFLVALVLSFPAFSTGAPAESPIAGAWRPELYTLKDGTERSVTGLIFFTERDWTVLFFEMGPGDAPQRGSGEGGTYVLDGDRLEFTHLYHLSGGSTPLRMSVKAPPDAETEPCRVEIEADEMTIHFPSGNRMRFLRSSR